MMYNSNMMKKLMVLLALFLISCTSTIPTQETSTPKIVYVEVTSTPGLEQIKCAGFYFYSWELAKEDQGALGMFFILPDNDYLIFAKGEAVALHEVGHLVDIERGYPSQSPEFEAAVIEYLGHCTEQPCWRINYFYEQGQLDEVYAEFYMWDILYTIPLEFEVFYAR